VLDLWSDAFWSAFLLGLLLLYPLRGTRWRHPVWALVNMFFVACVFDGAVWTVVSIVLVVYGGLRLSQLSARSGAILAGVATLFAALFALYKLPCVWPAVQLPLNPLLSLVGFSYLFLRVIDLLRAVGEGRHPVPGLLQVTNYLVPFHMVAAGPIQSYDDFARDRPRQEPLTVGETLSAAERIVWGLFKKFVLAALLSEYVLTGFSSSGWYFVLEVQLNFLWLYLDFSAYSDIAVGVGRLIGVATPENFDRPYFARNLMVFWERWHISLSQWVRRHLFLPVQMHLMRLSAGRYRLWIASLAFFLAFLLCGLWHGLHWPFFVWGMMHAVGLIVANLYRAMLKRVLDADGFRAYQHNRVIAVFGTVLTSFYVAFSLVPICTWSH
jgi:membrane protein involved in D-alanine export